MQQENFDNTYENYESLSDQGELMEIECIFQKDKDDLVSQYYGIFFQDVQINKHKLQNSPTAGRQTIFYILNQETFSDGGFKKDSLDKETFITDYLKWFFSNDGYQRTLISKWFRSTESRKDIFRKQPRAPKKTSQQMALNLPDPTKNILANSKKALFACIRRRKGQNYIDQDPELYEIKMKKGLGLEDVEYMLQIQELKEVWQWGFDSNFFYREIMAGKAQGKNKQTTLKLVERFEEVFKSESKQFGYLFERSIKISFFNNRDNTQVREENI